MAKVNASLPQGTRDFGPETVRRRNYILESICHVFELYGFQPLETPAMENLDTLLGKYGEEGDKLIFKILNNGLGDPKNIEKSKLAFDQVLDGKSTRDLTERALKYDLTIPFARYVAMHHAQLTMPFKRYQVQPVWRADRPQKGRYREFFQCDADVVGSYSLLNEIEFAHIYATVFEKLGIDVEIRINNRKILAALAQQCGGTHRMTDITVAIDKLDKAGLDKVKEELAQKGLFPEQVKYIEQYLTLSGDNSGKLSSLKELIGVNDLAQNGMAELEFILNHSFAGYTKASLVVDLTLARGLNYYTGTIFEVNALQVQMGSIGGGGRYDDLTGLFGVPDIPGVGISFGIDRIYDVMIELGLFPPDVHTGSQALFFNLGDNESKTAFSIMQELRSRDIRCELYHEAAKFDKQFRYAEKRNIPYIVIIGSKEMAEKSYVVKNLRTGEQQSMTREDLMQFTFN